MYQMEGFQVALAWQKPYNLFHNISVYHQQLSYQQHSYVQQDHEDINNIVLIVLQFHRLHQELSQEQNLGLQWAKGSLKLDSLTIVKPSPLAVQFE